MVNKGRIYREIRDFREIFWNLIKSNNEFDVAENCCEPGSCPGLGP